MKAEEKKKRSILGEWFMYFFGIMMWSVSTEIQKLDAVEKQNKKLIQVPKSLFDKQNSKEISPKHAVDLFVFHLLFHGMQMIPKRDRWDVKVTETSVLTLFIGRPHIPFCLTSSPSLKNIRKTGFS